MTKIPPPNSRSGRVRRIAMVFSGILAGQLILYGASFAGAKILLPLEVLSRPGIYIPLHNQYLKQDNPQGGSVTDPVFEDEPARIFRHAELRAGRLPIWNPYQYAGVPNVSFLSPFAIFAALVQSPRILPWLSLLLALVSGFGTYLFNRRVLQVGIWPATIAAWCYPISGFFIFWQSASLPHPVVWLPWLLFTGHAVLSRSGRWAFLGLSLTVFLTLISGHLDMAGLVLITAGLFMVWDFLFLFPSRDLARPTLRRGLLVAAGWALGFMLASSELVHALEYAATGSRIHERAGGSEERPPIGLASLPQLVLPYIYGSTEQSSFAILPKNEPNVVETPASGFAGLIATLLAAPLAWGSRRHRSATIILSIIAFLGIAWCLDIPGITSLMRLPGLNLMSFNRFVFATSFAIVSLAAIGLDELSQTDHRWHRSYYIPIGILALTAGYCVFHIFVPPQAIGETLPQAIASGSPQQWVTDMAGVHRVQLWFTRMYLSGAIVCLVALAIWLHIRLTKKLFGRIPIILGLLILTELLFFSYGLAAQSDPRLYYPPFPELEQIAHAPPGRVVTYQCLPANLLQVSSLLDVRGYDGVDPARLVELLDLAAAPDNVKLDYAAVQCFNPRIADSNVPGTVRLSPVLDLLGVRYVIIPAVDDTRYHLFVNPSALPRAFVPRSVELQADAGIQLVKLGDPLFDPRQVAYVEQPVVVESPVEGEAIIVEENPQRITLTAKMASAGLVVLADQWNSGWRAYVNDKSAPILRVDHALRGVVAPTGESRIVFRYQPLSLRVGFGAAVIAVFILGADVLRSVFFKKKA